MLEDKIKEYLDQYLYVDIPADWYKMARDIAEIVEKEFNNWIIDDQKQYEPIANGIEENAMLSQVIKDLRFDLRKLEKENAELKQQLAITKDRIIKVLNKYNYVFGGNIQNTNKQIANEILNESEVSNDKSK